MIRAVLDPNVLVSAFTAQRGSAPDRVVRAWRAGAFELVLSPKLIAELTDVLHRPRFAPQAGRGRAAAYVSALAAGALRIGDPVDPPSLSSDPDDDYLVALAVASRADVIVSGDRHLLDVEQPPTPVLAPREFTDRIGV